MINIFLLKQKTTYKRYTYFFKINLYYVEIYAYMCGI